MTQELIAENIAAETDTQMVIERGRFPHRPTVENRVAFEWERMGDVLGHWNMTRKNLITIDTLAAAVPSSGKGAVLDVGCAYGNMLLMLNAKMGKPADVKMIGIDLHSDAIEYAKAFARVVPGYRNCEYQVADLSVGLPFEDGMFDAVNLGDVLEHMVQPAATVRELMRVTRPGGLILISTPLKTGLFKTLSKVANAMTGGKVYKTYYKGKDTPLDEAGQPVMVTAAGHDHVSEMKYGQLIGLLKGEGLVIEKVHLMPVMSGSHAFDRHLFLTSIMMWVEAWHSVLKFRSWAHSVMIAARVPGRAK